MKWLGVLMIAVVAGSVAWGQDQVPSSATVVPPEGAQPGDHHPAYSVAPTGPIRGSLFQQGAQAPVEMNSDGEPMGGEPISFTAVKPDRPHKFAKNDVITIVVSEVSTSSTTGDSTSKRQQTFDTALKQFIQLALSKSGLPTVGTVGNPASLPEVSFNYQNNRQNDATQDRTDSASLRISGTVVDVKPNGTLVVEATKDITMDKEVQHYLLSGICRVDDVQPDNTVLSTQLANMRLSKKTTGEVSSGTKSGWLNQIIDKVTPF